MNTYEEYNRIRDLLLSLEPSKLVDALMTLAIESPSADMLVRSLASTTREKIALFKESIHSITHQSRHNILSGERILDILTRSLEMLDSLEIEPKTGLKLMVLFYETDSWALESTTELDYEFEILFTQNGYEKFAEFAKRCSDSDVIINILKQLYAADDYSMRTRLYDEASAFLSDEDLIKLKSNV